MALATHQEPDADVAADTPTLALADFIVGVGENGVPATVRRVLSDAVVDAVGCALFGLTTEACQIVQSFALEEGGPPQASIWGSGGAGKVSMAHAALANGVAVHGFDFDDHSRAKIHPGAAVIPAALAAAEHTGANGETVLRAIAAGYEVMNRVSLAADPSASRTKGWHLTGTTGTFAAAAAVGVILGLDRTRMASALGIAGTQSSGLWAFNADGAMTKRLHPGLAARAGVTAARLAQKGFTGPHYILEASDGGFLAATSDTPHPEEVIRGLGRKWRTEATCFKPYACCGSNHASVGAAIALKATHGFAVGDIERIEIGVAKVVLLQTGFAYRKSTVLNAQMSIRYNVAVALLDDAALVQQFTAERLDDPELDSLIARTDVVVDPEMDAIYPGRYAGIVTIHLSDGRSLRERVDFSKGMPENPIPSGEIDDKFRSLVEAAAGPDVAADFLPATRTLFETADIAAYAARLGAVPLRQRMDQA